ncbi:MAG: hypothetical protein ACREBC_00090 [Pyrinomonadaceae bacterium]
MTVGYVLLALAYALLLCGIGLERLSLILVGSAFAGATCFGFIYLGGLAAVIQASGQKKARAVSGYFLFAYLGLGLPCILTGFLADSFGVFYALAGSGFIMAFILICTAIGAWFVSSSKTDRNELSGAVDGDC